MSVPWWQRGAIYQVYPRSFADGSGDGVGDLPGLVERLDHIAELGMQAVWLSPIFPSPMADFGYDVSDYCDVDPVFGTLEDVDRLVEQAHARGMRVILDWVPNHTSDRHPWFQASRSARNDPRRDWYVWRDGPAPGEPPNDWTSQFAAVGPAWTFDEATGQWYLHSFMAEQPDLNWDNPEVEAAMHDVIRFWLDRGVDGLRLDAIHKIAKDPLLRSHAGAPRRHDEDWETIHPRLRGIRRVVDEFEDRMVVGEVALQDLHRTVSYLESGDQLHLAHNFVFVDLPWDAEAFRTSIDDFEALADRTAWPAWFLENHDKPRIVSRFDDGGLGPARARAAALMLFALRGTPFVYQGQELGLPDAEIPPERVVDVDGRDPVRAPMPWRPPSQAGPAAGFSTAEPWLPAIGEAERLNAETQGRDDGSMLNLVRRLAALRAQSPVLQIGDQQTFEAGADVLAWLREHDGVRIVAAVNFAAGPRRVHALPADAELMLTTGPAFENATLGPGEGVILRCP
jgi:alpha-glucosidase